MIDIIKGWVDSVSRLGIEYTMKRYYSIYPAVVVSNEDPEGRGRIKVKINQIFGEDPLPNYAMPRDFRVAGKGYGEFWPPEIDDTVWVEFEMGDPLYPVYSGGFFAKDELPEEFTHIDGEEGGKIPKVRGVKTKSGHVLLFDEVEDKGRITIQTAGGHKFIVDDEKDKQKIRIESLGHMLVLDDTPDSEAIYLIHKSGAQAQFTPKGDINVASKNGNFIAMNAEEKSLTLGTGKSSVLAMDDKIVISEGKGKTIISMEEKKIQITTADKAIIQCGSATVDAGAVTIQSKGDILAKGPVSSLKIAQTGLIGLGGPAAELLDLIDQFLDAFINQPQLVMTSTGPSSPLLPPAMVNLIKIKALLLTIKGNV